MLSLLHFLSPADCASHLNTLEVDYRTYRLAHQFLHAALRQPLPCLQTLVLFPKLEAGHAADCNPVIPQLTWTSVLQPLLATLTRLEIGSRSFAGHGADSDTPATREGAGALMAGVMHAPALAPPAAAAGGPQQQHSLAAPDADVAAPTTTSSSDMGGLLHLKCSGIDGPSDDSWCLSWVSCFHSLTSLEVSLCSAGELDCDVIAQLQQLQCLTLHYYEDEFVTLNQLAPLSACCKLTRLSMGALSVELPVGFGAGADTMGHWPEPAAADEGGVGQAAGGISNLQPSVTAAAMGVGGPAALQNAVSVIQQSMGLPQLRRLTAGLMCKVSLCCFAPNLTRLNDVSTHADSAAWHATLPELLALADMCRTEVHIHLCGAVCRELSASLITSLWRKAGYVCVSVVISVAVQLNLAAVVCSAVVAVGL